MTLAANLMVTMAGVGATLGPTQVPTLNLMSRPTWSISLMLSDIRI